MIHPPPQLIPTHPYYVILRSEKDEKTAKLEQEQPNACDSSHSEYRSLLRLVTTNDIKQTKVNSTCLIIKGIDQEVLK